MALETFNTTAASITLTTGEMLELAPGTNQVLTRLEGWFAPAGTRRESTPRLWSHGTFSERGWRDQRIITVGGHIFTETRREAAEMTDTLSAALADGKEGIFSVNDADLGHREATVYIEGKPEVVWNGGVDIFFMIDMVAPDPRKYGDPATATTLAAAPGGGLAYDLFGSGSSVVANAQGNLLDNPGPYTNAGWGTSGAYNQSYETPIHGRTAMVWTKSGASYWITYGRRAGSSGSGTSTTLPTNAGEVIPVTPGQSVYASLDLGTDEPNADGRISIRFFTSAFASISASESPVVDMADNSWQTFTHSAVAPANAAYAWLEWGVAMKAGNTVGGERSWASDAYLGTVAPPSPSVSSAGVLDFGESGSPGTVTLENVGTADTAPVFTISGYAPGFTITEVASGARLIYTDTVAAGQTLVINAADGSVLLDGYADRSPYLIRREWTRVPGKTRQTYLFESTDNVGASLTLGVTPAWW